MTMADITANDGATAPVAHTFTGQNAQLATSTYAVWYEKLVGYSAMAWNAIWTRVQLSTDPKKDHVQQFKLITPKVVLVDGIEVDRGDIITHVTVTCPYALNSEENLKTHFGLLKNVLANAQITTVMVNQRPSS